MNKSEISPEELNREIVAMAQRARRASECLALLPSETRTACLNAMAEALDAGG